MHLLSPTFTRYTTIPSMAISHLSYFSRTPLLVQPRQAFPSFLISANKCRTSRSASTTIPSLTTATNHIPSTSSQAKLVNSLTWNEFLRLRKIRRRYTLGASLLSASITTTIGMSMLVQQNLEALGQTMFGLDPFIVIGVCTVACFGAGWLVGPLVGGGMFRLFHRRAGRLMADKERDFFVRIHKHRVDPTSSSIQNPVPDYYGEKITSVQGYRQWLKDQRAFNKKRQGLA